MRAPHFAPARESERLDRFAKPADKPKAEIPRDLAMAAESLANSPAVKKVLGDLLDASMKKIVSSTPGAPGESDRTIAHYEMLAIGNIQSQLVAMADELKINPAKPEEAESF